MIKSDVRSKTIEEQAEPWDDAAASNFIGGALLTALGAGAFFIGSDYRMGTSLNMGAGYFPRLVTIGLMLVGVLLVIKGWRAGLRAIPMIPVRPMLAIISAVLVFGYIVESAGLFITCAISVAIASLGATSQRLGRVVIVAVVLASLASLIFGVLLGLPLSVWPRSWTF
jgi:hypothetical protein